MPYICIVSYSDIRLRVVQKCWSVYVIVYYFINCLYLDEHGSRSFGSGFRDRDRDRSNRYGPPRDRYEWNGDRLRRPYYLCYLVCTVYCYMWANLPLLIDTDHCEHKVIFTLLLLIIGVHPHYQLALPAHHMSTSNSAQTVSQLTSTMDSSPLGYCYLTPSSSSVSHSQWGLLRRSNSMAMADGAPAKFHWWTARVHLIYQSSVGSTGALFPVVIWSRVYFRPLKKGVVLPLAIVKKVVELPLEHIKRGSYSLNV